jgi:hypothetical protein
MDLLAKLGIKTIVQKKKKRPFKFHTYGAALQVYPYTRTMPLRLPQLSFAIICEGNELETFDVKQEGPSLVTAFVASAASKVGVPS